MRVKYTSFPALLFFVVGFASYGAPAYAARDAAFMAPSVSRSGAAKGDEAVVIEPKADIDAGDTPLNVGRRATFFFVNQSNIPVEVEGMAANGDSNVKADIVSDDCSKEKMIPAGSRCSVTIETTPTASGSWTAELLMTHKATGRIARARVTGKTASSSGEKREMGLALSTKDVKPVDFGEVEPAGGKAVRTALMVNDSNEVISILALEVIAPDNGLQKLDQGCAPDMDLKMGESCPITLVWNPEHKGSVSTDLIIRHTGRQGFSVIPIRGVAKEAIVKGADGKTIAGGNTPSSSPPSNAGGSVTSGKVPMSPTADEVEKMLSENKMPALSSKDLPSGSEKGTSGKVSSDAGYHLIGTVGNRALIYKPDGATAVVANGEEIRTDAGTFKLISVSPKEADVLVDGKRKTLKLETVSALTDKGYRSSQEPTFTNSSSSSGSKSLSSPKGSSSKKEGSSVKIDAMDSGSSVPLPGR